MHVYFLILIYFPREDNKIFVYCLRYFSYYVYVSRGGTPDIRMSEVDKKTWR